MNTWIGKDINNNIVAQQNEQPEINYLGLTWEEVTNYTNPNPKHLLRKLVVPSQYTKELTAINYLTELQSGVRLIPEIEISDDGLVMETNYYYKENDIKKPVIKVSDSYTYRLSDINFNPSERGMFSREKKWQYYFEDGTLDLSEINTKIKYKEYLTNREILEEGKKRRENIMAIISEKIGAILVILGVVTDNENGSAKKNAYEVLKSFSSKYSNNFTEYKSYATTTIYDSIQNDTQFSFLNINVPTETEFINSGKTQTEATVFQSYINLLSLNNMQGMQLRNYFIKKLKGL